MSTITTTAHKTKTCDRCGATGLVWKRSTKTGRYYLSEPCVRVGYTGKQFRSSQPHRCVSAPPRPLNTEPVRPAYVVVYGQPEGPVEDPHTHEHVWVPWRNTPGGITGSWCQGCRFLMVD